MKPKKSNLWVAATLSVLPIPIFAGYRWWMRTRAKSYWRGADPAKMYYYLTRSLPPAGRDFVTEEVEDMSAQMAAKETPFWGINYVTPLSHEEYIADLEVVVPDSGAMPTDNMGGSRVG